MNILNKVRWRAEKYCIDPLISFYLKNRVYQKEKGNRNIFIPERKALQALPFSHIFQNFATASDLKALFEESFVTAYERALKNDPYYSAMKEQLRYRLYINCMFAKVASLSNGNFCTVGVSYGVSPRAIQEFLGKKFWKNKKHYLLDKWESIYFSSTKEKKDFYCGDFDWIQKEFSEKNFQIIREYAPKAAEEVKTPISYLHLNTGDVQVEFDTILCLWENITSPGFIIIDSYYMKGFQKGYHEKFSSFIKDKKAILVPFASGQVVLIKL